MEKLLSKKMLSKNKSALAALMLSASLVVSAPFSSYFMLKQRDHISDSVPGASRLEELENKINHYTTLQTNFRTYEESSPLQINERLTEEYNGWVNEYCVLKSDPAIVTARNEMADWKELGFLFPYALLLAGSIFGIPSYFNALDFNKEQNETNR